MAVIAGAYALGATPAQAAIAEGASWVIPPLAYYAYSRNDPPVTPPRQRRGNMENVTPGREEVEQQTRG